MASGEWLDEAGRSISGKLFHIVWQVGSGFWLEAQAGDVGHILFLSTYEPFLELFQFYHSMVARFQRVMSILRKQIFFST